MPKSKAVKPKGAGQTIEAAQKKPCADKRDRHTGQTCRQSTSLSGATVELSEFRCILAAFSELEATLL